MQNIFCQYASIYDAENYRQRLRFLLYAWDRGLFTYILIKNRSVKKDVKTFEFKHEF